MPGVVGPAFGIFLPGAASSFLFPAPKVFAAPFTAFLRFGWFALCAPKIPFRTPAYTLGILLPKLWRVRIFRFRWVARSASIPPVLLGFFCPIPDLSF
jgi:hypothetical protein